MTTFRREKHLTPGEAGPDGFRPTEERTRITDRRSKLDIIGDRALWGGVALATAVTASLTAWSAAELLSGPYGHGAWSRIWMLGAALGGVADVLWLIMLLLIRRARAVLRTNPAAEKAAWGFAGFSVALIAGHAVIDGAGVKDWDDVLDVWTITLLFFAAFPILTKILWGILFNTFYLRPDAKLAELLDREARIHLSNEIRLEAMHGFERRRSLLHSARKQFCEENGVPFNELDDSDSRIRVELTRADHDTATEQDTRHDTETQQDATARQDTAPETRRDALPLAPPRPAVPPATPPLVQPAPITSNTERQDTPEPARPTPPREPAPNGHPSVPDVILTALRQGVDKDDKAGLRVRVEEIHGPIKENAGPGELKADTFRTSYRRAVKRFEKQGEGFYP